MWLRGENGANPGMIPPQGRGSDSRSRTHGRDLLNSGNSGGRSHCGSSGDGRGWPGLELPVGRGEDCLTPGLKLCPLRVLTMTGLEKDRRGRKVS